MQLAFTMARDDHHCTTRVNGSLLSGLAAEICQGKSPQTDDEKAELLKASLASDWKLYVALAAVISAIVAAIVTFAVVKLMMDKGGGNQVDQGLEGGRGRMRRDS